MFPRKNMLEVRDNKQCLDHTPLILNFLLRYREMGRFEMIAKYFILQKFTRVIFKRCVLKMMLP